MMDSSRTTKLDETSELLVTRPTTYDRGLTWTTDPPSEKQLRKDGYTVVRFGDVRSNFIEPSRAVTAQRLTLDNAAASLLRLLDDNPRLAILGVPVVTLGDLRDIYSFIVEPAFRRDIDLLLGVDRELGDLEASLLIAPEMGYPWTLERLRFIARRYYRQPASDGLPPLTPIEDQLLTAMKSADLMPQVQYEISRYRVDFAFVPERLIVEADGRAWHDAERDAARDAYLETLGWRTIRFSGSEIYRNVDAVVASVIDALTEQTAILRYTDLDSAERKSIWRRILDWIRGRRAPKPPDPYPDLPAADRDIPSWKANLDPDQIKAVNSMEGVVQVIAPAGSGKTTTMIARVQELLSRGVPANRILCTTFNKATREELQERLKELGVVGVDVKNFHALGRLILKDEDQLRSDIGTVSYAQWRRFASQAMKSVEGGVWLDAPVASDAISDYKLAKMLTPREAASHAKNSVEQTAAEIYRLYEEHLAETDRNDFDDLIISSLRLLQSDDAIRRRWQDKWECILVDEYQDIEPAQELLIHLIAAPEDSIFAVGDEDQCIYAWRRATVERIVMLDTVYPGLERTVLSTSYRCPPRITEAAGALIEQNKRRFHKQIRSNPDAAYEGSIELFEESGSSDGSARVASILSESTDPNSIVVLARTSRLLRDVVEACVNAGVPVNAPATALRPTDAEETILAYLRLLASPLIARDADVRTALRVPNRYLPKGDEKTVANTLNSGTSFVVAMEAVVLPDNLEFGRAPQAEWGHLMDDLSSLTDTGQIIQKLRTDGGLDKHYGSVEQMSPHDQTEIEALDDLQSAGTGKTPSELVASIELRATVLAGAKDGEGVELATIHGSKGREWDTVILYGADDTQMPHFRSLSEATNGAELQNAIEDERRLAYVAITRAKKDLVVVTTGKPSPFLLEAAISAHAGEVPTLAQIRKHKQDDAVPIPPKHKQAKFPGVCTACKRPIRVGTPIINVDGFWVHQKC